ncbi:hypothetical protein D3C75_676990 [compost metagenome]
MGAFAAGAAAFNGIERVDAYLRPDFKLIVDGKAAQLDKPILVYEDTSYLPVRAVSSLLGADVSWNNSSNTAYINSRYAGQPQVPEDSSDLQEIEMKNPTPMLMKYLGREYGLMTFYGDISVYYRVIDLNRMGVDTGGVLKYREKNTHDLYVLQQDVEKLWKERPEIQGSYGTIMSGVYDSKVKEFLQNMIRDAVPQYNSTGQYVLSPFTSVFFVDSVEDHPGYYSMYFWDEKGGIRVIVILVQKDSNGDLTRRSFSIVDLQYMYDYFSNQ